MLELNNLTINYNEHTILENVSMSFDIRTVSCLIGLNGSGKSTLLKSIIGLKDFKQGTIKINGVDTRGLSPDKRSFHFSLLEASTTPVFSILVKDLIELGARRHAPEIANALCGRVIDALHLKKFLMRDALTLSSGELQRVFLAHTLVGLAKYTLLDEPFSHLDWSLQRQVIHFLKEWSEEHKIGFLITLHELHWVPELTQNVYALGNKKLLASGPAESVFTHPEVSRLFDFQAQIDENPLDGTKRLTLGRRTI